MSRRKSKRKTGGAKPHDSRLTIGLLSEAGSPYHNALWAGSAGAASDLDVNLIFYAGGHISAPEHDLQPQCNILYDLVTADKVDGLLICGTLGNYVTTEGFKDFIDRYRPLPMAAVLRAPGIPNVIGDSEKGMRDLVTHFIEVHGYRRIAFICGPEGSLEATKRHRAYVDALAEHDLPLDPALVVPGAFAYETGIGAMRMLLDERKVAFDAVVAANDWMAFGALEVLEERGIRVPEDVALGGFDDTREAMASRSALTTVRQPIRELGQAGVEVLVKLLAGGRVPEETMLPTKLVVRQSCGCSDPVVVHAAVGPRKRKRESLQEAVAVQREEILSEVVQTVEGSVSLLSSDWAGHLLDAFLEEMASGSAASKPSLQGSFLLTLGDVLQQVTAVSGQVSDWQTAISAMRHCLLPYLTSVAALARAEDIFSQGRVLINRMAQRNWARQGIEEAQQAEEMSYLSGDLVTAVGTEQILDALAHRLPQLGFSAFYLSFYDGHKRPAGWSRLRLAYDNGERVEVSADGQRFPTRQLVPDKLFPRERRYTWVIESLELRENQFGYIIFEGLQSGSIYDLLARQISSALQEALLVQQLEARGVQLMTAAEVSQAAGSTLDLDELIEQMVELVCERFALYYAGLFLVTGGWAVLQAGTGDAGPQMVAAGHKLKIGGESMIGQCIGDHQARIALDVGHEAVRFDNPLLPKTRSELALPLVGREGAIGALTIQSVQERAFDEEDVAVFQTIADQLADAIENARLYEKIQKAYAEVEQQVQERTEELKREREGSARLQQEVIDAQQQALRELSTPIIPVLEGVLVMPLIGSVDTMRAKDVTRKLLTGIREHRAKVVILDITGVPVVDSGVAAYLTKAIQAARLKGARAIVTGVSDAVAETIVDLGIDWSEIKTLGDLQTGLQAALRMRATEKSYAGNAR